MADSPLQRRGGARVVDLAAPTPARTLVGSLVSVSRTGAALVRLAGIGDPVEARVARGVVVRREDAGATVVAVCPPDGPPIVTALVPLASPELEAILDRSAPRDLTVDGRRVVLEGSEEIVLQCGEASITLRADGRVRIRGVEILSHARGVHKIRGAQIKLN